jgi:hypothetical protein
VIAEAVIARCLALNRGLDIRLLVNAFRDYLQHRAGHSQTGWEDLLDARLREATAVGASRAERIEGERGLASRIHGMGVSVAEKERLWRQATGKSMDAYYRRLRGD